MANETYTANMNLPVPGVGSTDGPQYATDVNSCFTSIDTHDHSPGKGVKVTPNGLDISSDLSFQSNNLTNARSLRMTAQTSPISGASDLGCLYVSGVDLYFNDENGNQIRVTASGSVAGTSGSITNLVSPAAATYVGASSSIVFQSDTGGPTAASLDMRDAILRNSTAGSYGLTLMPPTLSADVTMTLPSIAVTNNSFLVMNTSGVITATLTLDGSTIATSGTNILVPTGGITSTQLASNSVITAKITNANVTRAKLEALGQQVSGNSGDISTTSTTPQYTGLTVTITTTGRPVYLKLQGYTGTSGAYIGISNSTSNTGRALFAFERKTSPASIFTVVSITTVGVDADNDVSGLLRSKVPSSSFSFIDTPSAGTHEYRLYYYASSISGSIAEVSQTYLMAYEL